MKVEVLRRSFLFPYFVWTRIGSAQRHPLGRSHVVLVSLLCTICTPFRCRYLSNHAHFNRAFFFITLTRSFAARAGAGDAAMTCTPSPYASYDGDACTSNGPYSLKNHRGPSIAHAIININRLAAGLAIESNPRRPRLNSIEHRRPGDTSIMKHGVTLIVPPRAIASSSGDTAIVGFFFVPLLCLTTAHRPMILDEA